MNRELYDEAIRSNILSRKLIEQLMESMNYSSISFINWTVEVLTIIKTRLERGDKITDEVSAKKAAQVIMEMGVQNVIVTLGSKGALIYCDSMVDMVPAIKVEAVDTTAAGDIFNGALTVALAEGRDLREAVRFACKASAISVTRVGAQSSVPYRNEVDIFD